MATVTINCAADNLIGSYDPYINYGTQQLLRAGWQSSNKQRSLLAFTALPAGIGAINSAKLRLYYSTKGGTITGDILRVHGLSRTDWEEGNGSAGSNWAEYIQGYNWASAGGDYDASIYGSFTLASSYTTNALIEIDVTDVVRDLLITKGRNRVDLILKAASETASVSEYITFRSREYTTTAYRPVLYLDYSTSTSYEDDATPATMALGGSSASEYMDTEDALSGAAMGLQGQPGDDLAEAADSIQQVGLELQGTGIAEVADMADSLQEAGAGLQGAEITETADISETTSSPAGAVLAGQGITEEMSIADTADTPAGLGLQGAEISEAADISEPTGTPSGAVLAGQDISEAAGISEAVSTPAGATLTGQGVTEEMSVADTAGSPAALGLQGSGAQEVVSALDTIAAGTGSLAGVAANEAAGFGDNASSPSGMSLAGKAISEAPTFLDAVLPASMTLEGKAGSEHAIMGDEASSQPGMLYGIEITETATIQHDVAPAGLTLRGVANNERLTLPPLTTPYALALYSRETGKPMTILDEFETFGYDKAKNEAGRITLTFAPGHAANKLVRDIYTAEPHGVYGVLYRRGEPFEGVIIAETDITSSPVSWSFLTFEAKLREHKTPSSWHSYEGMGIAEAITSLAEKGYRWLQINSSSALSAAAAAGSGLAFKTWHQLSGEEEGYNQPLILLARTGDDTSKYVASGTTTFAFDFGSSMELERLRWRMAIGEWNFVGVETRRSNDAITWTSWTPLEEITDTEYAETYGLELSGTARYLQARFTLRTEDTSSEDKDGNKVGTSPVLFGVEAITRYATGITAHSIDTEGEVIATGFDFDHENHLAALASICEDYGYRFRIDHLNRLYVSRATAATPHIVKRGETAEPQVIAYRGIDSIENALTVYGAGDGLGRLSVQVEDAESIGIYGRRPGTISENKINDEAELQSHAQEKLYELAWPKLECQIRAPYQPDVSAFNARVGEYIAFLDGEAFDGEDNEGYQLFEITSERRSFDRGGELIEFGLNSDLSNLFTAQSKADVKRRYKRGRMLAQIPFNLRATGDFGSARLTWNGAAPEYLVEKAELEAGPYITIGRTTRTSFTITGLATGTGYWFRVRAVYGKAISGASFPAYAVSRLIETGDLDTTPPATPTGLSGSSATYIGAGGAIVIYNTLSWTANSEGDLVHYELRRKVKGTGTWQVVGIVPAGMTSFVDTQGLAENTTYEYSLAATDKVGNRSEWSAVVEVATTKDATAPTMGATAPTVVAGFKRLAVAWAGVADADLAYYKLQRQEAPASFNSTTGLYEVPASPSGGAWADVQGSAARALTFHDTQVEFGKCYRYRASAVDTSGNASEWTNASAWAVPSKIGTEDAAYRYITAEMYGEIRGVLPFTARQEIDSSFPIEVPFYIPTETTNIVSIKLSAHAERFRATSKTASGGGAHSHSVTIPAHNHSVFYTIVTSEVLTGSAGAHSHDFYISGGTESAGTHGHDVFGLTSTDSGHSHSVDGNTYNDGSHSHSFSDSGATQSAGAHSHQQSITAVNTTTENSSSSVITSEAVTDHVHDIVHGIYEGTTPAGVKLYIDNGAGFDLVNFYTLATAPDTTTPYALAAELDITAAVSGTGWKRLRLTSTRLGAISVQVICKVDITA